MIYSSLISLIPKTDPELGRFKSAFMGFFNYGHELAHYLAIQILLKQAFPQMIIDKEGIYVEYNQNAEKSSVGKHFKLSTIKLIIASAGPLADLIQHIAWGVLANGVNQSFPSLSLPCRMMQIAFLALQIGNSLHGCLYKEEQQICDFHLIKKYTGIPPHCFLIMSIFRIIFISF